MFNVTPVLGIRKILVLILIPGSVPLANGSTDLDPTPFFNDFKDLFKKKLFSYFFIITYPQVHHLQS
jgi:hypothetical protein